MSLFETEACGTDETLVFGGLAGEVFTDEGHLCYHALPCFVLLFAGFELLEHLVVGYGLDLGDGDVPLSCLLLALLLDGVAQDLGAGDALSVEEVGGDGAVGDGIVVGVFVVALVVLGDGLAEGRLFLEALFVVELGPVVCLGGGGGGVEGGWKEGRG